MDSIYAETINSFSKDLDNLWRDKNAFSSVKFKKNVSIEDGNYCTYNRFMLSTRRKTEDDISLDRQSDSNQNPKGLKPIDNETMSLIDRLAKTAPIWTLPEITRTQTENILSKYDSGIFLVRMTTDSKTMVLSYKVPEKIQHVMIKVDLKKGFYMDGSQNIFRNVNHMLAHYMKFPLSNAGVSLKLPKILMEAYDTTHFQFFENMKINFWTTSLSCKSINDIWPKQIKNSRIIEKETEGQSETCPPLPARRYSYNELNVIQGQADNFEESDVYQAIQLKSRRNFPLPSPQTSPIHIEEKVKKKNEEQVYSHIWTYDSHGNEKVEQPKKVESCQLELNANAQHTPPKLNPDFLSIPNKKKIESSYIQVCCTIPDIIKKHYPHLVDNQLNLNENGSSSLSLKYDILQRGSDTLKCSVIKETKEEIYTGLYATPWDMKNTMIRELMDFDNRDGESQSSIMAKFMNVKSSRSNTSLSHISESHVYETYKENNNSISKRKESTCSIDSDSEEELNDDENRLQVEFLKDIESVMFSPSPTSEIYASYKSEFGKTIREFLIKLCSKDGNSDIAKSIQLFISCTTERNDLSPYTTMRLIRQYMGGLKNLITKNQNTYRLNTVIDEVIKKTPKNVFINLDSIIESVLSKFVIKPLRIHIYKLLVLEHYKNNNLKQIAQGVETSKVSSLEQLGLKTEIKSKIDYKLESIQQKFNLISRQYSPEKKIKYMISIVDIVLHALKLIYPNAEIESMEVDIKSDKILPLFVYIFSQCKLDAMAMQCEVEYVEGLIWSSKLVNGEPGFFLLNLMSAIEAIKVLSRSSRKETNERDKSSLELSPSQSNVTIGSVNVIIMDEKINRLITKTFPVRSTVTVSSLCNTISHRLGIFNPKDYNLYQYNGYDEILLPDYESPLMIKQNLQQQFGENINFLFRRKNANFIIPSDIPSR